METQIRLLTPRQVATALGVTTQALRQWRWKGEGPRWVKLSKQTVRYREEDVEKWLLERQSR